MSRLTLIAASATLAAVFVTTAVAASFLRFAVSEALGGAARR